VPSPWSKQVVERSGRFCIGQARGRLGKETHRKEPLLIEGHCREGIAGKVCEVEPRLVPPPELHEQMHADAPENRPSRIVDREVVDRRLDLLQASLKVREQVPLQHVVRDRRVRLSTLSDNERLRDELLGLGEPALRDRDHRLCAEDEPELSWLSQLAGDAARPCQLDLGCGDVARRDVRHELVDVALHEPFVVADLVSHLEQLPPQRDEVPERVGRADRNGSSFKRIGERGGTPRLPRDLDSFPADGFTTISRMLIPKSAGQTGKEPHPKLDVALVERRQPLLEQRHEPIVATGPPPNEAPSVAGRRSGELSRTTETTSNIGRLEERLLGNRGVPCSDL
jgi:hypothetical protein